MTTIVLTLGQDGQDQQSTEEHNQKVAENRLALQIFAILDHFKQPDPVGLPIASVPDPMPIPDITQNVAIAKMDIKNAQAYGLSKFRIVSMKTDLLRLCVEIALEIDETKMEGDYQMSLSFFSKAAGPFQVHMKHVVVTGNATLAVNRMGKLETQDIVMDIGFHNMSMNFENLGNSIDLSNTKLDKKLIFVDMPCFSQSKCNAPRDYHFIAGHNLQHHQTVHA